MERSSNQTRTRTRRLGGIALFVAASALTTGAAHAQVDVAPPLPNILLLVDTSGSMEYDTSGNAITCNVKDATLTTEPAAASPPTRNRWHQLLEVLTGDFTDFACYAEDRACPSPGSQGYPFRTEFGLGSPSVAPYDCNYYVPYHRLLSGTSTSNFCAVGPGTHDATHPFEWGSAGIGFHKWNDAATSCAGISQSTNGLLDTFALRARFGLMTFDTLIDASTGLDTGTLQASYSGGTAGAWSYFPSWDTTASGYAQGRPGGCSLPVSAYEVGARNGAAPPWEGRMIPFGKPTADSTAIGASNQRIQQALLAMRPYGATPINGMLQDASDFLLNDASNDRSDDQTSHTCSTTTGEGCFGPKSDPYANAGCRSEYVILLTDGEPNQDLRPYCELTGGACPYPDPPEQIAWNLSHPAANKPTVKTFVVGFAVSTVDTGGPTPVDCSQLSSGATFDPQGYCTNPTPALAACCTLAKIAWNGGTTNAYFASDKLALNQALTDILSLIATGSTSRTFPVFAQGASATDTTFAAAFSFLSSFEPIPGQVWDGVLERQRTICVKDTTGGVTTITPQDQTISRQAGDNFGANLNAADATKPRRFYTVLASAGAGGEIPSDGSIRATGTYYDGVAAAGNNQTTSAPFAVTGTVSDFFTPKVPEQALRVVAANCAGQSPAASTDAACADRIMKWEIGLSNGALPNRVGHAFGGIYHSTPALFGTPNEFLRDDSYTAFQVQQANRPLTLLTATNDGQVHAFKVARGKNEASTAEVNALANNELWSFFPPAVLPNVAAQYPGAAKVLLDGPIVVKNVIYTRTTSQAQAGTATWNTAAVGGLGSSVAAGGSTTGTGYFALDVTKPVPVTGDATTGPQFLWQLTTDNSADPKPLFGTRSGTPTIVTLYFDPAVGGAGAAPVERSVVLLPGGDDAPTTGACARAASSFPLVDSTFAPRSQVPCYGSYVPGRSLTVVDLKTGEIIRTFRRESDTPASLVDAARHPASPYAKLDSPIVGTPVAFPSDAGAIAQRAYVGDRDGGVWRVDFSSPDPTEWRMDLVADTCPGSGSGGVTCAWNEGQPIGTAPALSVDRVGNLTIAVATGDQETFTATGRNWVWSFTEMPDATHSSPVPPYVEQAAWYLELGSGERVSGPMTLFNSVLYFSSFAPGSPSNSVCSAGVSRLWGVDYITPATSGQPSSGPVPRLERLDSSGNVIAGQFVTNQSLGDGTVVFGVGVTQKPSCADTSTGTTDPYIGGGTHYGFSSMSSGQFQLVVQSGWGGRSTNNAITKTMTRPMASPPALTRIDSWAAVVDP